MKCNLCNRRVKDTLQSRWKHVTKYHPVEAFTRLIHLAPNARNFGEQLGKYAKAQIRKT